MRFGLNSNPEEGDAEWWELTFLHHDPGRQEEVIKDEQAIEFLYSCLVYIQAQYKKESFPLTGDQLQFLEDLGAALSPGNRELNPRI
jgi:hypothetical protein